MFLLAVEDEKLRADNVPKFPMLKEAPAREGFLEPEDFPRLRQSLPEHLRTLFTLAYYTGMRAGEIRKLRWENVDLLDANLCLRDTKNGRPRTVPLNGETVEMLKNERARCPGCERVFSVGSFRKAWKRACVRAGARRLAVPRPAAQRRQEPRPLRRARGRRDSDQRPQDARRLRALQHHLRARPEGSDAEGN